MGDGYKVFVGCLGDDISTAEQLREIGEQFGEVADCKVGQAKGGHARYGFLKYLAMHEAEEAIKGITEGAYSNGRTHAKFADAGAWGDKEGGKGHAEVRYPPTEARNPPAPANGVKLFVGAWPYEKSFDVDAIWTYFQAFGELLDVIVIQSQGKPKGCLFVIYKDHAGAQEAIQKLDGTTFPDSKRPIVVKYADKDEQPEPAAAYVPPTPQREYGAARWQEPFAAPERQAPAKPSPYARPGGVAEGATKGAPPPPSVPRSYGGWTEYFTTDGRPYYSRGGTSTTWIMPPVMREVFPI